MAKNDVPFKFEDRLYVLISQIVQRHNSRDIVNIGVVTSLKPLTVKYKDVDFSTADDTLYCSELLLQENINLDIDGALSGTQNIKGMTPPPLISPTSSNADYTAQITGTIPDFIKQFYTWFKTWHDKFILHKGDLVAIQKVGENKIIVLNKVSFTVYKGEENG